MSISVFICVAIVAKTSLVNFNVKKLISHYLFQVFTPEGVFLREIFPQGKGKGRYAGLACDNQGYLLATRTEKAKSFIQVHCPKLALRSNVQVFRPFRS